ncbi:hypothetical protein F2Q69_00061636 [Brassica cretica]|uniref:S-acyltransferase n=1 Tax=Brassica cretica TaxID=69181 RepID=A0A8S9RH56_BRACR|nr:hypothetical protein F2Q69_00061636 [Brassica cretica]
MSLLFKRRQQHGSRKNGSFVINVEGESASSGGGRRTPSSSWGKLVLDLYPPGTSLRNLTCGYCHVEQPPRAKHCHDCDRCVLQFDHHCVWLGTCVGQKNHSDKGFDVALDRGIFTVSPPSESIAEVSEAILDVASDVS